jgi:hypothetical protein
MRDAGFRSGVFRLRQTSARQGRLGSGRGEWLGRFVDHGGKMEPAHAGCYESWGAGAGRIRLGNFSHYEFQTFPMISNPFQTLF